MNSKQFQKIERLKAEAKLAYSEAEQKEEELRKLGFSSSEIKAHPEFASLHNKVWELHFLLAQAKGKDCPVNNASEYQKYSLMKKHEMEAVDLAKAGHVKLHRANDFYRKLRAVRHF